MFILMGAFMGWQLCQCRHLSHNLQVWSSHLSCVCVYVCQTLCTIYMYINFVLQLQYNWSTRLVTNWLSCDYYDFISFARIPAENTKCVQKYKDPPLPVRILGAIRAGDKVGLAR